MPKYDIAALCCACCKKRRKNWELPVSVSVNYQLWNFIIAIFDMLQRTIDKRSLLAYQFKSTLSKAFVQISLKVTPAGALQMWLYAFTRFCNISEIDNWFKTVFWSFLKHTICKKGQKLLKRESHQTTLRLAIVAPFWQMPSSKKNSKDFWKEKKNYISMQFCKRHVYAFFVTLSGKKATYGKLAHKKPNKEVAKMEDLPWKMARLETRWISHRFFAGRSSSE